jgi:hypothetical protein
MSKKEFKDACDQLIAARFNIVESVYNDSVFGSWYITLDTTPCRRIVWEGRDYALHVEEKTDEIMDGSPVWKTLATTNNLQYEEIPGAMKEIIGSI